MVMIRAATHCTPLRTKPSLHRAHTSVQAIREHFAPSWLTIGILMATLATLGFLYPRTYIQALLHQQPQPDAATIAYLRLMVMAQPRASDTRIFLARTALKIGDIELAKYALTPWQKKDISQLPLQLARLRMQLLRLELYTAGPGSAHASHLVSIYVNDLEQLAARLDTSDLLSEAHFAIALGHNQTAAYLYQLVTTRSKDPKLRRKAFQAGIDALLAAGQPQAALTFAQRGQASLIPSVEYWRLMTRLALMADRPKLAAGYARKLVGLGSQ